MVREIRGGGGLGVLPADWGGADPRRGAG